MMLEILHTHLLHFFLGLIVLSYEQALANNATCEHSCRVNSTIVFLQFYVNMTDLTDAKKMCRKYNSTLLSERQYSGNSTCFNTYLQSVGDSTSAVWLDPEYDTRHDIVNVLNTTEPFSDNSENGRHSMICISPGSPETSDTKSSVVNTRDHSPKNESTSGSGDPTDLDKDRPHISTKDYSDNKQSTQPGTQNPTTSKNLHWDVALPVALVTAATVLSICCITCVVCGVVLFRKREKIIKSIRTINTPVGSATTTLDSVELTSTVNVYANIKRKRPNSGRHLQEARFLNNSDRVHVVDDKEIYSTVDTENTYSNMDSLLRAKSPDQPYKFCDGSSWTSRQYDNMAASSLRPPAYASCVASSDNESQRDRGRYISDGLLYVTLDHTGHERKERRVKAKSDEHVEYLKLDFDKSGKMYKKKHRSLGRSKTREV